MAKTLAQLRKEIAGYRKQIAKESKLSKSMSERSRLNRELFELKNRKLIGYGKKAKALSGKFGRGILKAGKKAAPLIKKQAGLIRDQQLRDNALDRARSKIKRKSPKRNKKKKQNYSNDNDDMFGNLDF